MEVHRLISKWTRRFARIPGGWRISELPRRFYATRFRHESITSTVISDFDGDLFLKIDRSAYMGELIYWRGAYSLNELKLLDQRLGHTMTFLDIGANLGEFTLFAAKRLSKGRVLAFEPLPEMREQLAYNILRNDLDNVVLLDFGLSCREEELEMFTSMAGSGKSNEGHPSIFESASRSISLGKVRFRVLDTVLKELGVDRVDMMKIDAEGAELLVLEGAQDTLSRVQPDLLIELNAELFASAGYTVRQLLEYLESFGYRFFRIGRMGHLKPAESSALYETTFANVFCSHVD